MRTAWRHNPAIERHSTPVEMRFVDLFMAALGALIFMAMLLAFLLRYFPRQETPSVTANGSSFQLKPFQLATRTLPPVRAGEQYEIAFAFKGGLPPIIWEVAAGQGEIPMGLSFDVGEGILKGVPQKSGHARFVVRAKDQTGGSDSRPYDLAVLAPAESSKKIENWLACIILAVAFLLWLVSAFAPAHIRSRIHALEQAYAEGKSGIRFETGAGTHEEIEYDGGLNTLYSQLRTAKLIRRFFGIVLLALLAFVAWRLWFA